MPPKKILSTKQASASSKKAIRSYPSFRHWFRRHFDEVSRNYMRTNGCWNKIPVNHPFVAGATALYDAFKEEIWTIALQHDVQFQSVLEGKPIVDVRGFEFVMLAAAAQNLLIDDGVEEAPPTSDQYDLFVEPVGTTSAKLAASEPPAAQ